MKIEEAEKKWCPFVRTKEHTKESACNCLDNLRNPDFARCIGPQCACWREVNAVSGTCGLTAPDTITTYDGNTF